MKKLLIISLCLIIGIFSVKTFGAITKQFSDVPPESWFYDAVMNMVDWDVIRGHDDGTFKPADNVNRAELSVMWNRYHNKVTSDINMQTDYLKTEQLLLNHTDIFIYSNLALTYTLGNSEFSCTLIQNFYDNMNSIIETSQRLSNSIVSNLYKEVAKVGIEEMNKEVNNYKEMFSRCIIQ